MARASGQRVHVPAKGNEKLAHFMELVNANEELYQLWRLANMNAVVRSSMSDHGPVHVQIVANGAYKMLRLLQEGGITPNMVSDHGLTIEDSAIVAVGGALLHDIGMAVQRDDHEKYSIPLAWDILRTLLSPLYDTATRTTLTGEILHAIVAHHTDEKCLTIEAGVVKVADALDLTHGRSRIPFEAGVVNIHSVSAHAIESVEMTRGTTKPVHVQIKMNNFAGIFQLDELLRPKLLGSSIANYVEISATITGEPGKDLGVVYSL